MAEKRRHFTVSTNDFYKDFKLENSTISEKVYKNVCDDFFIGIMKNIIYENSILIMPYGLGHIYVKSYKANLKHAKVDFHRSKQLGKVVRHLNTHTFGHYFGFKWDKTYARTKNKTYYSFRPTRSNAATELGIGRIALSRHILALSKDPNSQSYMKL